MLKKELSQIKRQLAKPKKPKLVRYKNVRRGQDFLAIERRGFPILDRRGNPTKQKEFVVSPHVYIKHSNAFATELDTGKDAIFSLFDFCVVMV